MVCMFDPKNIATVHLNMVTVLLTVLMLVTFVYPLNAVMLGEVDVDGTSSDLLKLTDIDVVEATNLKSWMTQNEYILQDKTYQLLSNDGINTIDDLQQFRVDEFDGMCAEMEQKIAYGDRVKLKRVLESLSNKDKFVDPEEVDAIQDIKVVSDVIFVYNVSIKILL